MELLSAKESLGIFKALRLGSGRKSETITDAVSIPATMRSAASEL